MEPASKIIQALGGPKKVSEIVGVHRTRVSNWKRPKEKGGTGGLIPMKHASALLEEAKRVGANISARDFFPTDSKTDAA